MGCSRFNSLILDFISVCGIVVYKVEKSKVLMLLQTSWDLELKFRFLDNIIDDITAYACESRILDIEIRDSKFNI
jgi:hypothetical protein